MGACASSSSLHAPALFAAPLCARAARRRLCGLCRRHGLALLSTAPLGEDGTDADAELPEVAEVAERFNGVDARCARACACVCARTLVCMRMCISTRICLWARAGERAFR